MYKSQHYCQDLSPLLAKTRVFPSHEFWTNFCIIKVKKGVKPACLIKFRPFDDHKPKSLKGVFSRLKYHLIYVWPLMKKAHKKYGNVMTLIHQFPYLIRVFTSKQMYWERLFAVKANI